MEYFNSLQASQNAGTVTLTWLLNVPFASAVSLQRASYGSPTFTTIATPPVTAANVLSIATDTPGTGDWTYRLAVTTPQGGVDQLGTVVFSNYANISTETGTGVLTLSSSQAPSNDPIGYTNVTLTWTDASVGGVDLVYQIQRQIGTGAFRTVQQINSRTGTYTEALPAGSGPYTYQILALIPPVAVGKQQLATTSNQVTVNP